MKKKILILMGRYLPGYKDGGPLRTIINLTDTFGEKYDFFVACLDRDHGDTVPYQNIQYNCWNLVGKAKVWYVPDEKFTYAILKKLIYGIDVVYVCGFYNDYGYKTLILNRIGKIKVPVYVASMGTFSQGALSHKTFKKKSFIFICKLFGLFKKITWSVTSDLEAKDMQAIIGKTAKFIIAEDLPRKSIPGPGERNLVEKSIVFLSRICPQKNLLGAIKAVEGLKDDVSFDIYGPKEDLEYWNKCEKELMGLPKNIVWRYCGNVPTERVQSILQKYNIFLFPTLGENYGHVIFEALSVGCIPIISDQTPWGIVGAKKAGMILPLSENMNNFSDALSQILNLSKKEKERISYEAMQIAKEKVLASKKSSGYIKIFG